MSEFVKAGAKKNFADNEGTAVEIQGQDICITRVGETFYAFENRCSHAESRLSGGVVEEGEISCPLHGARFALKTGEAMTLPATKPVRTFDVKVEGENVFVKL